MSRIARMPRLGTVVSMGFYPTFFYLDLIGRFRRLADIQNQRFSIRAPQIATSC
jgi:hypothetical protein